jgi:hypothetical protein
MEEYLKRNKGTASKNFAEGCLSCDVLLVKV